MSSVLITIRLIRINIIIISLLNMITITVSSIIVIILLVIIITNVHGEVESDLSNMTKKPSVVLVGINDSKAALPRWSQKGRERRSMRGHDTILTHRLGSPVSKSKACI